MKILIIGSGGREHALAWKVARCHRVQQVFVAPGNAGTALEHKTVNLAIDPLDQTSLLEFVKKKSIDLTIIGPEAPLADGLVDYFQQNGAACFGPTQAAARLETSKAFCKQFLKEQGIPTPAFKIFIDTAKALKYLKTQRFPLVIKASGLAAGKGVIIAETEQAAATTVRDMLEKKIWGPAGQEIIIEEFISGNELSFTVLTDGKHVLPLASAKDYKRRNDGNKGPNTGGMGAYSPVPQVTHHLHQQIMQTIIKPTLKGMAERGTPYYGFLYAGLIITPTGVPTVLEFNCRLGDPEAQTLLYRLQSDLIALCQATQQQYLNEVLIAWDPRPAVSVVLAENGYPHHYQTGHHLQNIHTELPANCKIFHAGTQKKDNHIVTSGGRVLSVTASGSDLASARHIAYMAAQKLAWPSSDYRHDIGKNTLNWFTEENSHSD